MLQSKHGGGWLAVSPDAIAVGTISSLDGCFVKDDNIIMFMEMKTRQSPTTIEQTRTAKDRHGTIVYCSYGSDTFEDCVFSENRKQLLHQAMVTGLAYGVYVSAILVDGESEICQLVIVRFSDEERDGHFYRVNRIGRRLLEMMTSLTGSPRNKKMCFVVGIPCGVHCIIRLETESWTMVMVKMIVRMHP